MLLSCTNKLPPQVPTYTPPRQKKKSIHISSRYQNLITGNKTKQMVFKFTSGLLHALAPLAYSSSYFIFLCDFHKTGERLETKPTE